MKCVSCNEEIQDLGDITQKGNLCDKCKNNEVRQDFYKTMKLLTDQKEITDEEIIQILGSTVKHDNTNKVITFLNLLCNYTDEDQANLGFLAGSSTGKSYLPIEIGTGYFPQSDLMIVGYCSPTAFFHEYGTLLPDPEDKRDLEPEKKRKIRYINLHQKIIIFLDQPHAKLLENLRPLLSHDQKQITMKITNRSEKSGNRSENIVIEGYPTVVFCSANYKQDEQEKTRLLLLSPEVTQDKLRETIALKIHKDGNRYSYKREISKNSERTKLAARIDNIRKAKINQIVIPEELQSLIYDKFIESHPILQARNQRDIGRLVNIIKGYTLLNFYSRNWHSEFYKDKTDTLETDPITALTVQLRDVEIGFKYYNTVAEANELGIPPEVYTVFNSFKTKMQENSEGFTRKDFQTMYFKAFRKFIGREKAKAFIDTLETAGLIIEQPDPTDKRIMRYVCEQVGVVNNTSPDQEKVYPTPSHTYYCIEVCENYQRAPCPFYSKVKETTEKPLGCSGFKEVS